MVVPGGDLALSSSQSVLSSPFLAGAPLVSDGRVSSGLGGLGGPVALSAARRQALSSAYGRLPLSFEKNRGQSDRRVSFVSRGSGYALGLTERGAMLSLARGSVDGPHGARSPAVLGMGFVGGRIGAPLVASGRLAGRTNYLVGKDHRRWHTGVPSYSRVSYRGVWSGVDVSFYGNQRRLEYDFVVRPGADPGRIALRFSGARGVRLDRRGDLVVGVRGGTVRELAPRAYQRIAGVRRAVASRYVVLAGGRVAVRVGGYDHRRALVIDPALSYATYLGGSGVEYGARITVDASDNAYVAGYTTSVNFPVTAGAAQTLGRGGDAFVAKLNAAGTALVYSTYLGGSSADGGFGVKVDANGNAYVTGYTISPDFPTTLGASQMVFGGGVDQFVSKLNASGSGLIYSTFLGGTSIGRSTGIAVDASGSAYVSGETSSSTFPTTVGAAQTTNAGNTDAFVSKLNPTGTALVYSTFLGGAGDDLATGIGIDDTGNAYVSGYTTSTNFPATAGAVQTASGGGQDAFVAKLNPTGSAFVYASYLGGGADDQGFGIAVDPSGSAYVAGVTSSRAFPVTPGAAQTTNAGTSDAFVSKLNPAGSALSYSSYLGGRGDDFGNAVAVDANGNAYVTGQTSSPDFPTTPNAAQPANGGGQDAFVAKLNATGSALSYSSYLGGSSDDFANAIAVNTHGDALVIGTTTSTDFPVTPGAPQTAYGGAGTDPISGGHGDAFVANTTPAPPGPPPATGGSATTPTPETAQTGGGSSLTAALAIEAPRASALRSCLAAVAAHSQRERKRARRSSARKRARARRHIKRHASSGRRRCLRLYGRTPGRVTGLQARVLSATKIVLSFNAPGTDGNHPPAARSYLIKQSPRTIRGTHAFARARTLCNGNCRFSVTQVGGKVTLTITGLHPRTTYHYAAAAHDNVSGRLGPRSQTVSAKTS